ncbi:EthD family reductase [Streptomyces uncialis]|uniref:EthD domain-containing protein n=1 Tax=Streptomyces uncialis TaxID=1048205 RepID=UPI0033F7B690
MIHQLIFAAPKPGMTEEEFHRYWVEEHAVRYASRIPQIKRYAVDTRVALPEDDGEPLWNGVAEIWLENEEEQLASLQTPEFLQGARLDEPNWAAFWRSVVLDTDTEVVVQGRPENEPQPGVKVIVLGKRREGMSRDAFRRYSRGTHAPLAAAIPGVRRYHQSFTRDSWYGISEPPFDVAYHLWFDSTDTLRAARRSAEQTRAEADYKNFLDERYVHTLPVRQHWVIGPEAR